MKKIIAISTLLAAASTMAATTSTKKIDVSEMSITERMGGYIYLNPEKDTLSKEEVDTTDSNVLTYLQANYKITNDAKISGTFRVDMNDSLDENGKGDRFEELDPRLAISSKLWKNDTVSIAGNFTVEVPTSRASIANGKTARIKPAISATTKIDDYNTLFTWLGYNRDIYSEAPDAVADTSRFYYTPWIIYTNSYLSEKYQLKLEYSSVVRHISGAADTQIRKSETDTLNFGVVTDIYGVEVNPYLQNDVSEVKAANTLGGGVQIFKAF